MRSLKSKLNLRISLTTQAFHKVKNNYVGMAQFLPLFQVWFIFTKHLAIEPTNMLHESSGKGCTSPPPPPQKN